MQRRHWIVALPAGALGLWIVRPAWAWALTEALASDGVREALSRGAESAVSLLGKPGGFLDNPKVRIPLPKGLESAASMLKAVGQEKKVDELETAMNRAAESAVPEAKPLLTNAVKSMSVDDALKIVHGGNTSVTDFFASKTRAPLTEKFLPIVTAQTQRVSLASKYDAVAGKAATFGLVKQEDANVEHYVTRKALDGLYLMIGEEEKKIRSDPVATGSALLKSVFGH
jgi:hypothetical protein